MRKHCYNDEWSYVSSSRDLQLLHRVRMSRFLARFLARLAGHGASMRRHMPKRSSSETSCAPLAAACCQCPCATATSEFLIIL